MIDAGTLGRPYYAKASWLRRQGIPMLGSWFTNRNSPAVVRWLTSACTSWTTRCTFWASPRFWPYRHPPISELGPRGLGGNARYTASNSSHKFEVEDFASAFIRLEGGGTLILEAGWATYRDERDLMDFTVYGTDGGADLRAVGASETPSRTFTSSRRRTAKTPTSKWWPNPAGPPGRRRRFHCRRPRRRDRLGKPRRFLALSRALVLDACYKSALEQREVVL